MADFTLSELSALYTNLAQLIAIQAEDFKSLSLAYVSKLQWKQLDLLREEANTALASRVSDLETNVFDVSALPIYESNNAAKLDGKPIGYVYKRSDGFICFVV